MDYLIAVGYAPVAYIFWTSLRDYLRLRKIHRQDAPEL
jgi:hypothetical protein